MLRIFLQVYSFLGIANLPNKQDVGSGYILSVF